EDSGTYGRNSPRGAVDVHDLLVSTFDTFATRSLHQWAMSIANWWITLPHQGLRRRVSVQPSREVPVDHQSARQRLRDRARVARTALVFAGSLGIAGGL